jgi:peroxiredoxin
MAKLPQLTPGDPVPWFVAPTPQRPDFNFHTAAGRYVVLTFVGSAADPAVARAMGTLANAPIFDDVRACHFAVTCERDDVAQSRLVERTPGFRLFLDFNRQLSTLYGAFDPETRVFTRVSLIIDRSLRLLQVLPWTSNEDHVRALITAVASLPSLGERGPAGMGAPALIVPRVFEDPLCRELIAIYDREGGEDSGFMRTDSGTGKTVSKLDHSFKRRRDCSIKDDEVRQAINTRIQRRLVPEIRKAFQFHVTRIERHLIACYDATEGGFFRAHRDDTSKGTAHRRFAVTINLNAEDYEGGDLRFPEYDSRFYRPPTGGAIVFSCSLLHEVWPVTKGRRFCVLPFLYDEAAAALRLKNMEFLAEDQHRDVVLRSPPPKLVSE